MRATPAAIALLLLATVLAGCGGPSDATTTSTSTSTFTPPPTYPVTIRVVAETMDGPPIEMAEVYLVEADSTAANDPSLLPPSLFADKNGEVRTVLREPDTLFVQAFGPVDGTGWTREGLRLEVGENVTTEGGEGSWTIVNRTLVLPLMKSSRAFQVNGSWTTAHAEPNPPGNATPAAVSFPVSLGLEPGLERAYLDRATRVELELRWCNSATSFADLAAGVAWGPAGVPMRGDDQLQTPGIGCWTEGYDGPLPAGDRTLELSVLALTHKAVVGDVSLEFKGKLRFTGVVPEGLAKPPCYPMAPC